MGETTVMVVKSFLADRIYIFLILFFIAIFVGRPTIRTSVAQRLFKVDPEAGPKRARHSQKCKVSRRHHIYIYIYIGVCIYFFI